MIKLGLSSSDSTLRTLLSSALSRDFTFVPVIEKDGIESLHAAPEFDVAILDLNSNDATLERRLEHARQLVSANVPLVVMADDAMRATASDLVREGAFGYCRRPPSIRELKTLLLRAYENSTLHNQVDDLKDQLDNARCDRLIGSTPQMQRVYQLVRSVSNLNASVLVQGESGTGKELVARAIHNLGYYASRPFVAVSCGAIPETLIEAELFGHEKGSFTGADGSRAGYFEQAGNGTLFLDEIGDLSMYTQVKLLRVLQQMEFSRIGSTKLIPLKARLVFATHQDLMRLVSEGKFRQDLYYRINVVRIEAPALRDHVEDIPMLADHLLRHFGETFGKVIEGIEPEAMEILQNYNWPGNVRELENVLQRALILGNGRTIRAEDLSISAMLTDGEEMENEVYDIAEYAPSGSFERQLRDYKIKLAVSAVKEHDGNKTLAARSLCISRAYLHRLLRLGEGENVTEIALRKQA